MWSYVLLYLTKEQALWNLHGQVDEMTWHLTWYQQWH